MLLLANKAPSTGQILEQMCHKAVANGRRRPIAMLLKFVTEAACFVTNNTL